jgi:hypothetical protein
LVSKPKNKEDEQIQSYFLNLIKAILKTLESQINKQPKNMKTYVDMYFRLIPIISFKHSSTSKSTSNLLKNLSIPLQNQFSTLSSLLAPLFTTFSTSTPLLSWSLSSYILTNIDIYLSYLLYLSSHPPSIQSLIDLPNPCDIQSTLLYPLPSPTETPEIEEIDSAEEVEFDDEIEVRKHVETEVPEEVKEMQTMAKQEIQKLWDGILRGELKKEQVKEILKAMNTKVFPKVDRPILFSDFIISAYDLIDGSERFDHLDVEVSIHALSSLFILLVNHGLDYTSINFYQKLYSLLDYLPNIFRMKEKEKFLRLLELSLKSPMLPSAVAASFMKK